MARRTIAGSRILITGASQGIGRALAVEGARRGAKLVITARSADIETLADELRRQGAEVEAVRGDVTNPDDRRRMIETAVEKFGGLDILINNAGIGATGHFIDASEDRLRKIFEVNFFAVCELIRLALPVLMQGNKPMIVNISSAAGKRALPARSEYSASKFALQGFTDALRAELVRFDIDVLSVCPGLTATNFPSNMIENKAKMPLDHLRAMTPEQVAVATYKAIERGKHEIVLTWQAKLLSLMNRLFPKLTNHLVAWRVKKLYADEIKARKQQQKQERQPETASAGR
ncbi:MAG: SDR family oxidoreductase [Gemmatales bacterium]|nr:SDR family oxidoreductase [Gemmatales bacterium]MDW8386589.1 SDR family oxidoreductase [Gemmatales bacterium]